MGTYYVSRSDGHGYGPRYVVKRFAPYGESTDSIRDFVPRKGAYWNVMEPGHVAFKRAKAFAAMLNEGGPRAERALREAGR